MKSLIAVTGFLLAVSVCDAASITKGKISHKLSEKETCAGGNCGATVKASLSTSIEASLNPAEADGFGPDTTVQGTFPMGPYTSFKLTDDPNYQPGDTSVNIAGTVSFNNIAWTRDISLDWADGTLKLNAKVTASPTLGNQLPLYGGMGKTKSKLAYPSPVVVSLIADNGGTEFLNLRGAIPSSTKSSRSTSSKSGSDAKLASTVAIKGKL